MLIFGTKGFKKPLGPSKLTQTCSHCHNNVNFETFEVGRKFSLFFVPLFTLQRKKMVLCPICSYGYDVTDENREQLL